MRASLPPLNPHVHNFHGSRRLTKTPHIKPHGKQDEHVAYQFDARRNVIGTVLAAKALFHAEHNILSIVGGAVEVPAGAPGIAEL